MSDDVARASFILSDEMREYFTKIGITTARRKGDSTTGYFPALIHPFYLCMIMGIIKKKTGDPTAMKKTMVDEWLSDARSFEEELDGLGAYYDVFKVRERFFLDLFWASSLCCD